MPVKIWKKDERGAVVKVKRWDELVGGGVDEDASVPKSKEGRYFLILEGGRRRALPLPVVFLVVPTLLLFL